MDQNNRKQLYRLGYKILHELLFLSLVSLAAFLLVEGIAPGLFTAYLSFTKIVLTISLLIIAIAYIRRRAGITTKHDPKVSPLLWILALLSAFLVANSLFKSGYFTLGLVTLSTIGIIFFLYRSFFDEKE